jgi:hypothetical protein
MDRNGRKGLSRREFLKTAALGAGAGLVGLDGLRADALLQGGVRKRIPVGVQLYSVRASSRATTAGRANPRSSAASSMPTASSAAARTPGSIRSPATS